MADQALVKRIKESDVATANFRGADLRGADLSDADLSGEDLSRADLREANLSGANLSGADLRGADLSGSMLNRANLSKARLSGSMLRSAALSQTVLKETLLNGADLVGANLKMALFVRTANFCEAKLNEVNLSDEDLGDANFSGANLSGAQLSGANFSGANLNVCNLSGADLSGADLSTASLVFSDLVGSTLEDSDLRSANLNGASVSSKTCFTGAMILDCKVEKPLLDTLNNYGGLTLGEVASMEITDPVKDMKTAFAGFQFGIHLISVLVFFAPYLWFTGYHWIAAKSASQDSGIPIREALWRYVFSGGKNYTKDPEMHWTFPLTILMALYSISRIVMIWKTSALALEEKSSGLPSTFSFERSKGWRWGYNIVKWGVWLGLLLAGLNLWHFLGTKVIPIGP